MGAYTVECMQMYPLGYHIFYGKDKHSRVHTLLIPPNGGGGGWNIHVRAMMVFHVYLHNAAVR